MYAELKEAWAELTAPGAPFEIEEVLVHGQKLRAYANAPSSLRDIWLVSQGHADRDALVYGEERWTYGEAHSAIGSVANWLAEEGLQAGDRVAIAMRNYPEWLLSYWAVVSTGLTVSGLNAWWTENELEYALKDSDPRVLICDEERYQLILPIRSSFPDLKIVVVRGDSDPPADTTPWSRLLECDNALPDVEIDPDSDACIFYTSGTTGRPKGAQLTHRGCTNNLMSLGFWAAAQGMALGRVAGETKVKAAPKNSPAFLATTPLFHVTANNCIAQPAALSGGKVVLMYKWEPAEALRIIEAERITNLSGVPVMSRELLAHPDFDQRDTSSLVSLGGGGAPLQPDLVKRIGARSKASPSTGYGMTETCGIITANASAFFLAKPESAGPVMPCFEAKCVDEDGMEIDAGGVGELWVRGAQVIRGYLNRSDETESEITDGWLHTGDIARIDEDGFVYIVDRAKDMVLRGGENVYCSEVEAAIFSHDAVMECAAFSVPDDRLGEEVGVAVLLDPAGSLSADELRAHCASQIAKFKVPRYVWFLDEAIPRNASGKFLKRQLQEELDSADAS
jgi:long-chain acyl-CoA synthetase